MYEWHENSNGAVELRKIEDKYVVLSLVPNAGTWTINLRVRLGSKLHKFRSQLPVTELAPKQHALKCVIASMQLAAARTIDHLADDVKQEVKNEAAKIKAQIADLEGFYMRQYGS